MRSGLPTNPDSDRAVPESRLLLISVRHFPPKLCSGHPDPADFLLTHTEWGFPLPAFHCEGEGSILPHSWGSSSIHSTEICYLRVFTPSSFRGGVFESTQGIPTPRLFFLQRRNMTPSRRWFIGGVTPILPSLHSKEEHLWGRGRGQAEPNGFQMCFPRWRVTFSTHATLKINKL